MSNSEKNTTVISEIIKADIGKYSVHAKKFRVNGVEKHSPIIKDKRENKTVIILKFLKNGKVLLVDKWNPSIEAWHQALPSSDDIAKNIESFNLDIIGHILNDDSKEHYKGIDTRILKTKLDGKFYSSTNDIVILSGITDFDENELEGLHIGDFIYGCIEGEITDPATVIAGLKLHSMLPNIPKEMLNRMNGAFVEGVLSTSFENPYQQKHRDQYNDWYRGKDFVLKFQGAVSALLDKAGI